MLKIVSFLVLSVAHFLTVTIASAAESNIILVLDGSGSMWGQINNRHKIEIERSTLYSSSCNFYAKKSIISTRQNSAGEDFPYLINFEAWKDARAGADEMNWKEFLEFLESLVGRRD